MRFLGPRALGRFGEFLEIDADRESAGDHLAALVLDRIVEIDLQAHLLLHIVQEALQPFGVLEAEHVVFQHGGHQPLVERQRDQQARRRPGGMEEQPHAVLHALFAKLRAERKQVIVVDPDEVFFLDQWQHRVGEARVDPLVALTEIAVVFGQIDAVVEQRPERAVGVAVVVFLDILRFEVDRGSGDAVVALHVEVAGELLGFLSGPAEPDAAMFAQGGVERHGEPPLRPGGACRLGDGDPVRDDDQSTHYKSPAARPLAQGRARMAGPARAVWKMPGRTFSASLARTGTIARHN